MNWEWQLALKPIEMPINGGRLALRVGEMAESGIGVISPWAAMSAMVVL